MKGGGDYQRRAWRWVEMVISERGIGGVFGAVDKAVEVSERAAILPII